MAKRCDIEWLLCCCATKIEKSPSGRSHVSQLSGTYGEVMSPLYPELLCSTCKSVGHQSTTDRTDRDRALWRDNSVC